jgi:hypothetical protein
MDNIERLNGIKLGTQVKDKQRISFNSTFDVTT